MKPSKKYAKAIDRIFSQRAEVMQDAIFRMFHCTYVMSLDRSSADYFVYLPFRKTQLRDIRAFAGGGSADMIFDNWTIFGSDSAAIIAYLDDCCKDYYLDDVQDKLTTVDGSEAAKSIRADYDALILYKKSFDKVFESDYGDKRYKKKSIRTLFSFSFGCVTLFNPNNIGRMNFGSVTLPEQFKIEASRISLLTNQ